MNSALRSGTLSLLVAVGGCVPNLIWTSEPQTVTATNDIFSAEVTPHCKPQNQMGMVNANEGCTAFTLKVVNKTKQDIEINWNKTMYIEKGQTSGGFMFEGVVYKDRNNLKPNDIVFAGSELTKTISPNNLVAFSGGWYSRPMPEGQVGVYLTVVAGGKEINERFFTTLSASQSSR